MSTCYVAPVTNPLTGALVTPRDWHRLRMIQLEEQARIFARRQSDPMRYADGPSIIPVDETPIPTPAPAPDPIDLGPDQLNARRTRLWEER